MTSQERRQNRYERRKIKRAAKKKRDEYYNGISFVCSQQELEKAYLKCRKGVRWKASVQQFGLHLFRNTRRISKELYSGRWKSDGFMEFDIIERGHPRHILSVNIGERCVQRTLCDHYLVPLLSRPLIYDNGATLPNKGNSFSINRFKSHLEKYIRNHGTNGFIYFFDFSSYFANIDNCLLLTNASKYLLNKDLNNLYRDFILAFGNRGLGLGSQVSQISAVFYPNKIDHYIKDVLGIEYYGRYMDDGYVILNSKSEVDCFAKVLERLCEENHIVLNKKKCRCYPIESHYVFLKYRAFVINNRVILKVDKSAAKKERTRLKKYKQLCDSEKMSVEDAYLNFHSWLGYYYNKNNFYMLLNMIKYYNKLFKIKYFPKKTKSRKDKFLKYLSKRAYLNPGFERRHP